MQEIIIVGIGGFIGSNLRYFSAKLFAHTFGVAFPYSTLFVNTLGSFILGFITVMTALNLDMDMRTKLFIGTGMMGAFTTFSTFSVETLELFQSQNYVLAFSNVALNLVLSLTAGMAGFLVGRYLA